MPSYRHFRVAAALLSISSCVSPPKAPEPPRFDPATIWRDQSRGGSQPMVVDWSAAERGTLEVHSRSGGPLVVHFSQRGLEPLWDCSVKKGHYEYSGVSPKRDRIEAESAAELAANFPLGFAKLSARVKSGDTLSADMRMIGISQLDRQFVSHEELQGNACAEATHFVKEFTLGGFRFGAAAKRAAGAGVGSAAVGAQGSYEGSKSSLEEEGDFAECEKADPMSREAPAGCRGILRLRLVRLETAAAADAPAAGPEAKAERPECGGALQWDGAACVSKVRTSTAEQPAARTGVECSAADFSDCEDECKRGNLASCRLAGILLLHGAGGAQQDVNRGAALLEKACEASDAPACFEVGALYIDAQRYEAAAKFSAKGCLQGEPRACTNFAFMKTSGRGTSADPTLALKLEERACRLGLFEACSNAGVSLLFGRSREVPADPVLSRRLFTLACEAGVPGGCANLGAAMKLGMGGAADPKGALSLFESACAAGAEIGCVWGGLTIEGDGKNPHSLARAQALYDRACESTAGSSCLSTAELMPVVGQKWDAVTIDRHACDGGELYALGCYNSAIVRSRANGDAQTQLQVSALLKRACDGRMQKACDALARFGARK